MKLKTFRAPSMAEALTQVKKDLGKDAVILHTRAVKTGGLFGFRAKTIIEITAADEPVPTRRPAVRVAQASRGGRLCSSDSAKQTVQQPPALSAAALSAYRKSTNSPAPTPAPADLIIPSPARTSQPPQPTQQPQPTTLPVRQRRIEQDPAPISAPAPSSYTPPRPRIERDDSASLIQRELADIKLLVNQVLHAAPATSAGVAAGHMPDALFQHYLRLLESSVSRDIADQIIGAVRDELTPTELLDSSIIRTTVLRHIAGLIPVADALPSAPPSPRAGDSRRGPLVIALVGPTGVGKTTTIAKLAATYKLRRGNSVALITSDTYRIAAVDQLRTYAGIIGLPMKVVLTPTEMTAAVNALSNHDVILIDTAGRSQFNHDRIAELSEFLTAAHPSEVHLVLSTTASEDVLLKTAESFAAVRPNRVILTKLDEAVNFGVVVNVARRLDTQLSFITTGQEVPDHLEQSHPDRLARMVLDNTLISATPTPPQRRATQPQPAPSASPAADSELLTIPAGASF